MRALLTLQFILLIFSVSAQVPEPLYVDCPPVWQQNVFDHCIGDKGMFTGDFDGNGSNETVLGNGNTWIVLNYSPDHMTYRVVAGSREYDWLNAVTVADADNDGINELVVYCNHRYIELYDISTYRLKKSFDLQEPAWWGYSIVAADADNDGLNELMVSGDYLIAFFRIDGENCNRLYSINVYEGDARCGDIDGDTLNEIVTARGSVYRIENGNPQKIWSYLSEPGENCKVELTDIDNDSLPEIINASDGNINGIIVYEGDTLLIKWHIYTDNVPDCITVGESGNGGLPEILYVENQGGDIKCLEANGGSEIWSVPNPEYGGTNIAIGDPDGDGTTEFMYGANCTTTSRDYFFVFGIDESTPEYTSYDDWRFRAVKAADVDGDSQNELILMTNGSMYDGPGVIYVHDAQTKAFEWKTDGQFAGNPWDTFSDIEAEDVDNDGETELVLSGNAGDAALAVINGRTGITERVKNYNWLPAFEELTIADLNGDGTVEYLAGSYDSLYIIDSETLEITKALGGTTGFYVSPAMAGNIDDDPNAEVVFVQGYVVVMDGVTGETWTVEDSDHYRSCCLYDCNNDGIKEIIANASNGTFYMIDGRTREVTLLADGDHTVSRFTALDIAGDYKPELLYQYQKEIIVLTTDGKQMITEIDDDATYFYYMHSVTDYDNNGHFEIFASTNYYVQQLNADIFECIYMEATTQSEPTICGLSTGSAEIIPGGGAEPYSYSWCNGQTTPLAENLPEGICHVTVTDASGCVINADAEITSADMLIDSIVKMPDNPQTSQCEGNMVVYPYGGTPPYTIFLNTTPQIVTGTTVNNLCSGDYTIRIADNYGCTTEYSVVHIESSLGVPDQHTAAAFSITPNPSNGITFLETTLPPSPGSYAEIRSLQGKLLSTVSLTGQRTQIDLSKFNNGMYIITVNSIEGRRSGKVVVSSEE